MAEHEQPPVRESGPGGREDMAADESGKWDHLDAAPPHADPHIWMHVMLLEAFQRLSSLRPATPRTSHRALFQGSGVAHAAAATPFAPHHRKDTVDLHRNSSFRPDLYPPPLI